MKAASVLSPAFLKSGLSRHVLVTLLVVLTICSVLFLTIFVTAYRGRLIDEHGRASMQVNKLLEASLKNAMLKRDIPGLRAIIDELGRQQDIAAVYIVNPAGDIRFATDPAREGQAFPQLAGMTAPTAEFVADQTGSEVLRTVNPVRNEPRCQECHGDIGSHPVNGILVVDYAAGEVSREALRSAAMLTAAGGMVLFAALAAIAFLLQSRVLQPLHHLTNVAKRFAAGDLQERVTPAGHDEVAELGHRFNHMADSLSQMVEKLKVKEEFLQNVIDSMPDGVRVIGRDYCILKVNTAYCKQLDVSPDSVIGQHCYSSSHHLNAPCSPRLVTCPLEELKGDRARLKCNHQHLRSDGQALFVEISAARISLERNGATEDCVIEVIRDLAEQAEASHQHRLSEIGQIAAGVAHEIHNPLSSIRLALTAIQQDTRSTPVQTRVAEYIETANREIDRCLDVTSRLLRISEPVSAERTLLQVAPILRDVVALVSYQAIEAAVTISCSVDGDPRILAGESDLAIMALNIIQNSIHAMPGGGTLTIHAKAAVGSVQISFRDTGVGISGEDMQRIFWPFWSRRADGSRGTGLGLSICRSAVERMNGIMRVESAKDQGTTVFVTLPDADHPESTI